VVDLTQVYINALAKLQYLQTLDTSEGAVNLGKIPWRVAKAASW